MDSLRAEGCAKRQEQVHSEAEEERVVDRRDFEVILGIYNETLSSVSGNYGISLASEIASDVLEDGSAYVLGVWDETLRDEVSDCGGDIFSGFIVALSWRLDAYLVAHEAHTEAKVDL